MSFDKPVRRVAIVGTRVIGASWAAPYLARGNTETTTSPEQRLQWLAEQALNWSGLPVVHVRPTVLLEGFFLIVAPKSVRESSQIRLPFGDGKTSPVAVEDVARVIAAPIAEFVDAVNGLATPLTASPQMAKAG